MRMDECARISLKDFVGRFVPHNTAVCVYILDHLEENNKVYKRVWRGMDWQISYGIDDMPYFEAHPDVSVCPVELQYANVDTVLTLEENLWAEFPIVVFPDELVFDSEPEIENIVGNKITLTAFGCIDAEEALDKAAKDILERYHEAFEKLAE